VSWRRRRQGDANAEEVIRMAAKRPAPSQTAIRGRIVTMDTAGTVLADGTVYIAGTTARELGDPHGLLRRRETGDDRGDRAHRPATVVVMCAWLR